VSPRSGGARRTEAKATNATYLTQRHPATP
jgi:hypothetical protein